MAGYAASFWKDIELRIDIDPFCTSYRISSIKKKAKSKNPLNTKAPLKWVFMDIIPATAPKRLTNDITLFYYLLIVYTY